MNAETTCEAPSNKHVFVINGAVAVLGLVRELLQEEAFTVTTTNFVPQTWNQIDALQPDLVMVDLAVGQTQGWDLLEKLKGQLSTKNIPVIIFSTDPNLLDVAGQQSSRFGGQRLIAKPFDVEELLVAVHDLIGQSGAD